MEHFLTGAATLVSDPTSVFIFLAGLLGGLVFGAIPGVSMLTLGAIFLPFSGLLSAQDAIALRGAALRSAAGRPASC